jgi:diketogulonate reductase-like aldo/keto reductase
LEQRELGKTGEKVPTIGMGTWKMADTTTKGEWAAQVAALQTGIELGLTLIDTAESYGDGRSERLVGEALQGRRESVFLATKVSPGNLRYDDVLEACDRSLQRLGTKHIDLYQVHWPNTAIPIGETMKAMEVLVREGKVRYIGVSNFGVQEMKDAQDSLSKSELASDQVEYSATARGIERQVIPYCERQKVSVIAYSPLSRGAIPSNAIPKSLSQRYQMTPAQVVLNWLTHRESVIAIPKAARSDHVEENAKSVDRRFGPEDYMLLSQSFA